MRQVLLGLTAVLLLASMAQADLTVTWEDDTTVDVYANVDYYFRVISPGKWEALVDQDTGAIFSFKDLTDAGWLGDHANYVGQSAITGGTMCYNLQTPLLWFKGRETGYVMRRVGIGNLAGKLSFTEPSASEFVITYTEDGSDPARDTAVDPNYYMWGGPLDGTGYDSDDVDGDFLTTVTVTLNEADSNGTVIAWSVVTEMQDDVAGNQFASGNVQHDAQREDPYAYHPSEVAQSVTEEETNIDGAWNPANPQSYSTRTIDAGGNNATYGLTVGRTFTLDHVSGHDSDDTGTYGLGGAFSTGTWANNRRITLTSPYSGATVTSGTTKTWSGTLTINIGSGDVADVNASASSVSADPSAVAADGAATSTVTIVLKTGSGLVIEGADADITVLMTGTGNTIGAVSEIGNGVYECDISSTVAEAKTVSVEVDNGSSQVTLDDQPVVNFFAGGVDADNSIVTALLPKIPNDGSITGVIEIDLRDSAGDPVLGETTFTVHEDGGADLGLTVSEIGGGIYHATGYTNSTNATYTISVVADGVAIVDTADVEVVDSYPALFFAQNAGNANILEITCKETDDSQSYWMMTVDENAFSTTGGGGRCLSFWDLRGSGYSDPAYDYAYRYRQADRDHDFMWTAASDNTAGTGQVYTAGAKIDGMLAYNYTITGPVDYQNDCVVDSAVTIHAANDTGTKFESDNTFSNPTAGPLTGCRLLTMNVLNTLENSPEDGLWDSSETNDNDGNPADLHTAIGNHTVSPSNAAAAIAFGMVPGLSFTLTAADVYDYPYYTNDQEYGSHGLDYHQLEMSIGISDNSTLGPYPSGLNPGASVDNHTELMVNIVAPIPPAGDADADQSTVAAAPDTVSANGVSTTTVTIILKDAIGTPKEGAEGDLVVNCSGSNNIISAVSATATAGIYEATIASTTVEIKTISVVWDGTVTLTDQPTVDFIPTGIPDAALSSVVGADDNYIEADGTTTYTVTITLRNSNGDVVPGVAGDIDVNVTGGGSAGTVTEVGGGVYEVEITSTVAGDMVIDVTYDDGLDIVALDETVEVTFVTTNCELVYSGDDISAGDGTMTITCQHKTTAAGAWELDITRYTTGTGDPGDPFVTNITTPRFDDLTDTGAFNYAAEVGAAPNGLFDADANGDYVEITKSADGFVFSRTLDTTGTKSWQRKTVYELNPSNNLGMFLFATRTVENTGTGDQQLDYSMMDSYMGLGVGPCNGGIILGADGAPGEAGVDDDLLNGVDDPGEIGMFDDYGLTGAECYLTTPYDVSGFRYHKDSSDADAIWQFEDNVDFNDHDTDTAFGMQSDGFYDVAGVMWAECVVMDNATTAGLGMTAGRTWSMTSDIIAYYPAGSIGDVFLDAASTARDGLIVGITSREWNGTVRSDFSGSFSLTEVGQVVTKEFVYFCDIPCPDGGGDEVIEISASADFDWVYPNATVTTNGVDQQATITIDMTTGGADTYTIAIGQDGGALVDFQIPTASQLAWTNAAAAATVDVAGGLIGASTGAHTLNVTVTGDTMGGVATADVAMKLRVYGDVNDSGAVDTTDKLEINRFLNGIATTATFRELDLTGDGSAIDTSDKLQINRVLNGIAIP